MTLIIKELVVKSTIVDQKQKPSTDRETQLKEEVIRTCTNRLIRHFNRQNHR